MHGVVVGATSPAAADAVARIALGCRLVTAAHVAAFSRELRGSRAGDLDAFVDAMGLASEQVHQLKHRVLVQRASRTFAIERGDFAVEDRISIPIMVGIEVDVRAVVYHGARLVLDNERLAADLRKFGTRFVLAAGDVEIARFGFADAERRIVEALRDGTSAAEIDARHRDLDPRMVQAVIYALAACDAVARATTSTDDAERVPKVIPHDPEVARPGGLGRGTRRWTEPFLEGPTTVRPNALTARELRGLIAAGSNLLEQGVDHFTMLGLPIGASVEAVRTAYLEPARNLQPARLAELLVRDHQFSRARAARAAWHRLHRAHRSGAACRVHRGPQAKRRLGRRHDRLRRAARPRRSSAASEPCEPTSRELAVAELRTAWARAR